MLDETPRSPSGTLLLYTRISFVNYTQSSFVTIPCNASHRESSNLNRKHDTLNMIPNFDLYTLKSNLHPPHTSQLQPLHTLLLLFTRLDQAPRQRNVEAIRVVPNRPTQDLSPVLFNQRTVPAGITRGRIQRWLIKGRQGAIR